MTRPGDDMKLLRVGAPGAEVPALLHSDGTLRDISSLVPDLVGDHLAPASLDRVRACSPGELRQLPQGDRVGPCVARVPNFHGIGLNYARHAAEAGMARPTEPIVFSKATSCLSGPNDPIPQPEESTRLDYEVELGVVIGTRCDRVPEAQALAHVAGYCVVNDVSERAFQFDRLGQWMKGKSAPGFGPAGPWLVTADEVSDPQALRLWLQVNDAPRQDSSTADMIFGVAEIIAYLSRFMVLLPGDLICTGTPEGVGMGLDPPVWLRPGDVVRLGIDGLGVQEQRVVPAL